MNQTVRQLVQKVDRRRLTNNTQRVLLSLLSAPGEWVSLRSLRVPSAGSRVRDLRKSEFGAFRVLCATASKLNRQARTSRDAFYRLDPRSITVERVATVFEGVI